MSGDYFGGNLWQSDFFGSDPGFVSWIKSGPGFVNLVRSDPIRSDPIWSDPGFVNAHLNVDIGALRVKIFKIYSFTCLLISKEM